MPHNQRTGRDCAPTGPDETQASRLHPTQGVRQWAQAQAIAEAITRSNAALRTLRAIHTGEMPATPATLEALGNLLDSADDWLCGAIQEAIIQGQGRP